MTHPPIFIIGVPRSGTTYLYQLLSNNLDIDFIDNTAHLFYKRLPFGMGVSRLFHGDRPHNVFKSKHGKTWMFGMHAPSECTPYWQHFLTTLKSENQSKARSVLEELNAISQKRSRPMLVKNLSISLSIDDLLKAMPNARFVFVERDLGDVVKSMLRVRKSLGVDDSEWWSVKPSNYDAIKDLPVNEKVKSQAESIDSEIRQSISKIPQEQIVHINYPLQVSEDELVHKLASKFNVELRKN